MARKRKQQPKDGRARKGEACYQRKSDGRWCAPFFHERTDGTRKRHVPTGRTEDEARAARDARRAELAAPARPISITLGAWLDIWLRDWKTPAVRETTLDNYRALVRRIAADDALARTGLRELTAGQLQAFLAALHARTPAQAHAVRAMLIQAISVAMDDDRVERNVARRTKLPAYDPKRVSLTIAQMQRLLAAVLGDRYGVAVWLGLMSLRRGEVCDLRWDDVDLEAKVIHVRHQRTSKGQGQATKTPSSTRDVMITAETADALRSHRAAMAAEALSQGRPLSATVLCRADGRALTLHALNDWYRAACAATDTPGTFHSLRRTYVTLAQQAGARLKDVMAQAGHKHYDQTLVYTDPTEEGQRDAAARFGAILPKQKNG